MKNKIWPSRLTPEGKLKRKILNIAIAMLLLSLLLIDIINVRTASHENGMTVFIKNIYLMAPWGLAYLIASRHRDLLKLFSPLYMSLILLVTTCSLASHHFTQSQNLEEKFGKEMVNIINDHLSSSGNIEPSSQVHPQLYSEDEYGHLALYLDKFKKWMDRFKQENTAVLQAFDEVELEKVFTEEILFNFFNIITKKNQLERLSLFLDESANRTENIHSEYVTWILSSPEVDEVTRRNFADAISTSPEKKKFFRQEPYRIKKNIVREYITFLNFLSKAYGSYGIGENGGIAFTNEKDRLTWNSHCEMIENLFKEEEDFAVLSQKNLMDSTSKMTH